MSLLAKRTIRRTSIELEQEKPLRASALAALLELPEHLGAQDFVEPALIALALAVEPLQHVGFDAHRQLALERAIKFPPHRALPVLLACGRDVRKVDLVIRPGRRTRPWLGHLTEAFRLARKSPVRIKSIPSAPR
jgi:hypothetical protein